MHGPNFPEFPLVMLLRSGTMQMLFSSIGILQLPAIENTSLHVSAFR
jgi:hypothetical protein